VKTYIEELLTTFSGFHQTIFSFLTAHSLQQLFSQLTTHNNFFHSHSPTKQTLIYTFAFHESFLITLYVGAAYNSMKKAHNISNMSLKQGCILKYTSLLLKNALTGEIYYFVTLSCGLLYFTTRPTNHKHKWSHKS
jgi:hypothetical protein